MKLTDAFSRIITMRRMILAIERLAIASEQQAELLARIANHLAPLTPHVTAEDLQQTGPSQISYGELGRIQDFQDRVRRDLGREPTEDEIVDFLDGKEVSL